MCPHCVTQPPCLCVCVYERVGKLIPPEQYALRRSQEYLAEADEGGDEKCALVLPGFEHTYFFHGINHVSPCVRAGAVLLCAKLTTLPSLPSCADGTG